MIRRTLFAIAALGALAFATGCQSSGHAEAHVDTDRPHMTAETDASAYTTAYTVRTDTSYYRSSSDTSAAGSLRSGDTVYLRSAPPASGMVQARTTDGRIVWVRASDLSMR